MLLQIHFEALIPNSLEAHLTEDISDEMLCQFDVSIENKPRLIAKCRMETGITRSQQLEIN